MIDNGSKLLADLVYRGKIGKIYLPKNIDKEYRRFCSCSRKHNYEEIFDMMKKIKNIKIPSIYSFKPIVLKGTDGYTDLPMPREYEYDYNYIYMSDMIRHYLLNKYNEYNFKELFSLDNNCNKDKSNLSSNLDSFKSILKDLESKFEIKYILFLLNKEYNVYQIKDIISKNINLDDYYVISDMCYIMNYYKYDCMRCRNDIMQFYRGIHVKPITIKPIKNVEFYEEY